MSTTNLGRVVGDSAYEVAVSQGYVGTESEWLASLQGDEGPAGADGAAAGFGTPTISVSTLSAGSAATASVSATGTDTAKVFHFDFGIPQGEPGSGASLVAGTGIDITGDTISNTMPYDDAATASYIFNNFGMSVSTTTTLESATASIDGGAATVSLFWNRWSKPELSVYIDDTLTDTIEAEDWVFDSQTDYNTASLSGGGSITWVQIDQHFLLSGLSGSEVKLEYVGTVLVRTPLDDLYIDNTIARASDIPTLSAGDNITITTSGSVNTISATVPTFTESDPVFSASPAATITASDISNWNSIVGVPTATASDEGKALVVTDSTGSIGWGEVGGGTSTRIIENNSGYVTGFTNEDKAYLVNYINDPNNYPFVILENGRYYKPVDYRKGGYDGFWVDVWSPYDNVTKRVSYNSTKTSVSNYLPVNTFSGLNRRFMDASYIPVDSDNSLTSSNSNVAANLNYIKTNFPTPDGTTITASGNVWSAVGGGSSLTVSGGANISVNTVSDVATVSLADEITLITSAGAPCLMIENDDGEHSTVMDGDNILMVGTAIPEGEEDPYDKWINEISDDFINLQYHDWDDNEGNERLVSEVSINSEDANVTVAEYDINGDSEEYMPYQTTLRTSGINFYISDGNGTEHECKLYIDIDGSLLYEIDNDGAPHKLYDNSNPL